VICVRCEWECATPKLVELTKSGGHVIVDRHAYGLGSFFPRVDMVLVDKTWLPRRSNCTLNPPPKNILLSSMATAKDVEHRQMFSNSCVNSRWPVTFPIVTHYASPGPSASQNAGRGCVNPLFCVSILGQEPSLDSPQIAESQESPSQLRVDVTSMYPDSLIPR